MPTFDEVFGNSSGSESTNESVNNDKIQDKFDDCVRTSIRKWRKAEYPSILKIAGGTIGTMLAGYIAWSANISLGYVVRAIQQSKVVTLISWQAKGKILEFTIWAGPLVGAFTGTLVVDGFKESIENTAQKDKEIENCKKENPNADHSWTRISRIASTTW